MSTIDLSRIDGPHADRPVFLEGPSPSQAGVAILLLHGRGAGADGIIGLGREIARRLGRKDTLLVVPDAANATWYPYPFLAPEEQNQPWLDSARAAAASLVDQLIEHGTPPRRLFVAGFSQGACLASDTAARHPRRYGGIFALSGGLIGPPDTVFAFDGDLEGTPVFFGCSDVDMHIPKERVVESAGVVESLNGAVDLRLYEGMGHTINEDELDAVTAYVRDAVG